MGKYTLFKGRDGQYYWNLKASNGEILCHSEGYTTKQNAKNGIEACRNYSSDDRLWASSQLAGFAKKKDLPYFVKELSGADYEYREDLAPTAYILKAYKDGRISWGDYEVQYIDLINHRNLAKVLSPDEVNEACFLCACKTEHNCHRRLLAEYLQREWDEPLEIVHL